MSCLRNSCLLKAIMVLHFAFIRISFIISPFEFGSICHLEMIIVYDMRNGLRFSLFFSLGIWTITSLIKKNVACPLFSSTKCVIKNFQYICSFISGLKFTSIVLFVYTSWIPCHVEYCRFIMHLVIWWTFTTFFLFSIFLAILALCISRFILQSSF